MRIAIVQFPGSNCERETMLAVKRAGMEPVEFLWNQEDVALSPPLPKEESGEASFPSPLQNVESGEASFPPPLQKEESGEANFPPSLPKEESGEASFPPPLQKGDRGGFLSQFDGYIIVGGFSYEDRSRSGAIAALDPIMQIIKEQSEKGKPVLGICNGAQILVETGLVPGLEKNRIGMALTHNKRMQDGKILGTGFYNAWVHMRLADDFQYNAFTRFLTPKDIMHVPVAHGEGRFVIPPALLFEMEMHGLGVFRYCDSEGNIVPEFPINPNGSIQNIAAVSNKAGNVMAMMPHPERTPNGDAIFASMRDYIERGYIEKVRPLCYQPRLREIKQFQTPKQAYEIIVELMITDNHAMSVEKTLHQINLPVKVKRQVHWEIECTQEVLEKIKQSGVLYNDRKESVIKKISAKKPNSTTFLVRAHEDVIGMQKKQMLENHFAIEGIKSLRHSILWDVEANADLEEISKHIINSHILYNPYAYDCYYY